MSTPADQLNFDTPSDQIQNLTVTAPAPAPAQTPPAAPNSPPTPISQDPTIQRDVANVQGARENLTQVTNDVAENRPVFTPAPPPNAPSLDSQMYASSYRAAAPLAVLAALGGKFGHVSAIGMLGAVTGIVQGLSQANDEMYARSLKQYEIERQKWKDQYELQKDFFNQMLEANAQRIDAAQRALKLTQETFQDDFMLKQADIKQWDTYTKAADALEKIDIQKQGMEIREQNYASQAEARKAQAELAEARTTKILSDLANPHSQSSPELKAKLGELNKQIDQNMKQRGQLVSQMNNLNSNNRGKETDAVKAQIQAIDDQNTALTAKKDEIEQVSTEKDMEGKKDHVSDATGSRVVTMDEAKIGGFNQIGDTITDPNTGTVYKLIQQGKTLMIVPVH